MFKYTNLYRVIFSFAEIAEALVRIFSLGFIDPEWALIIQEKRLRIKFFNK